MVVVVSRFVVVIILEVVSCFVVVVGLEVVSRFVVAVGLAVVVFREVVVVKKALLLDLAEDSEVFTMFVFSAIEVVLLFSVAVDIVV